MILSGGVGFIHVPKTGGMSAQKYVINFAESPVDIFLPKGAFNHAREMAETPQAASQLRLHEGDRHATPDEAVQSLNSHGLGFSVMKFLSPIRRIDSLMRSYYQHLQKPSVWKHRGMSPDALTGDVKLAMENDFYNFCHLAEFYGLSDYKLLEFYRSTDGIPVEIYDFNDQQKILSKNFCNPSSGSRNAAREMPHLNSSNPSKSDAPPRSPSGSIGLLNYLIGKYPSYHDLYQQVAANGTIIIRP